MFFKQKITASDYCKTRLDLLFSVEQANRWLDIKRVWPDPALVAADDDAFLTYLRGAHIELLSMVITKWYLMRNREVVSESMRYIDEYLDDHDPSMKLLVDQYCHALASSPVDGPSGMVAAMMDWLCPKGCNQETFYGLRAQFQGAIDSYRKDFKQVKLVCSERKWE